MTRVRSPILARAQVLATLAASLVMDDTGRRPLLALSCGGMLLSTLVILAAMLGAVARAWALAGVLS